MKPRIKIDSSLLSLAIVMTGILFLFRNLYPSSHFFDNTFDFLGLLCILDGTLLRMMARGHKKNNSKESHALVTTGPYTLVRNPMYLGSCLIGCGFVLTLWPWWSLPIFVGLFYARFRKQVVKEEAFLTEKFGDAYKKYCKTVARACPSLRRILKMKTRAIMDLDEALSTKEARGLIAWPMLATVLELFQETLVFGSVDVMQTIFLSMSAVLCYAVGVIILYQLK